ncbi:DUF2642 domain-containing protein [Aneurinibacillus aneurinilyticus]|uniref:DUF2642 domain-containing protein n=1 Tax=Aneurinibacillus aneurinilyticus TaxID=1391 RepID=A0A848D3Q4_ANEAE|nr:DUF2642 domain-containing protein [Aneurinibacillus aneurinilyticus]MCI1696071.1 YuzF family protein [Aneurinibacillus aneurinilyticus]MED0707597.1 DUF2642 domain-containing protein [Aneurinibacillus aneurinilyticus]MED0722821.1 DUF2642 domain-containing protein [Aneurinibacillus aneurinilyticus]MED0731252.1 DUF2642 domain-containing protein [Aneurinibacillus aneurinilyticus]MED0743767.1 DUF2642 domain-containing protein [Aneurinibacillus aneurinilyticus]
MYYPSYSYGTYPYSVYPVSNTYNHYPAFNQVQHAPEEKNIIPQKESSFEEKVITDGDLISKEEVVVKEEAVSKSDTFAKRLLSLLYQKRGKTISVATPIKEIQGRLEEVFPDYIFVKSDEQHYHIRLEGIIYIS